MKICLNCNRECEDILCESCKNTADIPALCERLCTYRYAAERGEPWDIIAEGLEKPYDIREYIFPLSENLPEDIKAFYRIWCRGWES